MTLNELKAHFENKLTFYYKYGENIRVNDKHIRVYQILFSESNEGFECEFWHNKDLCYSWMVFGINYRCLLFLLNELKCLKITKRLDRYNALPWSPWFYLIQETCCNPKYQSVYHWETGSKLIRDVETLREALALLDEGKGFITVKVV